MEPLDARARIVPHRKRLVPDVEGHPLGLGVRLGEVLQAPDAGGRHRKRDARGPGRHTLGRLEPRRPLGTLVGGVEDVQRVRHRRFGDAAVGLENAALGDDATVRMTGSPERRPVLADADAVPDRHWQPFLMVVEQHAELALSALEHAAHGLPVEHLFAPPHPVVPSARIMDTLAPAP